MLDALKNKKFCAWCKHQCSASDLLIRAGLAFVFMYAGVAIFIEPANWVGYLPLFLEDIGLGLSLNEWLKVHGVFDIVLGVWILSGLWRAYAGVIAGVTFVLITGFSGTESLVVTFRNIGLACMAFSYAIGDRLNCGGKNDTRKQ